MDMATARGRREPGRSIMGVVEVTCSAALPLEGSELLDVIPDAVLVVDGEERCCFANRAVERLTGRARQELLGVSVGDLLPRHGAHPFLAPLRRAAAERTEVVFPWTAPSGSSYEVRAAPLLDRVVLLAREVATWRHADAPPASGETLYRALFEQSPDGIVLFDTHLRVTDFNDAFARLSRSARECILALGIGDHEDRRHHAAVRRALGGETVVYDLPVAHDLPHPAATADECVWLTAQFAPLRAAGGHIVGAMALLRDQTEMVTAELAARQDMARMGLLEDQLRRARNMEAIGQLAGGVTHDVHTHDFDDPLTAIDLDCERLAESQGREHPSSDEGREIQRVVGRADELTRQLSDFSRHQSARPRPLAPNCTGTVLLVDDDAAVRSLGRRILERHGFVVLVAADGADALDVAAGFSDRIDILVTDVVLPTLHGRELYARLRAARPALRVLFISGYTDDEILRRGLAKEGLTLIEKPFGSRELVEAACTALAGDGASRWGPSLPSPPR